MIFRAPQDWNRWFKERFRHHSNVSLVGFLGIVSDMNQKQAERWKLQFTDVFWLVILWSDAKTLIEEFEMSIMNVMKYPGFVYVVQKLFNCSFILLSHFHRCANTAPRGNQDSIKVTNLTKHSFSLPFEGQLLYWIVWEWIIWHWFAMLLFYLSTGSWRGQRVMKEGSREPNPLVHLLEQTVFVLILFFSGLASLISLKF